MDMIDEEVLLFMVYLLDGLDSFMLLLTLLFYLDLDDDGYDDSCSRNSTLLYDKYGMYAMTFFRMEY